MGRHIARRDSIQNVTVYTSDTCGYCHMLKEYLRARQVPYTEKNISTDTNARMELIIKGYMGVPVVLLDDLVPVQIRYRAVRHHETLAHA